MALAQVVRRADGDLGTGARIVAKPSPVHPGGRGAGVAVLRRSEGLERLEEGVEKDPVPAGPRRRWCADLDDARAAWPSRAPARSAWRSALANPDVVDVGCRGGCLGRYAAVVAA